MTADALIRPLYGVRRRLRQLSEDVDRHALFAAPVIAADLARWLALIDAASQLAEQCVDAIDEEAESHA